MQTQQQSYEAARSLLPLAEAQLASLGFPPEEAARFRADFAAAQERYALPDGGLPPYLRELISGLWIGTAAREGAYYSCVLPLHTRDEAPFRAIAAELPGRSFMNKVKDIGSELDALTRIMLLLFVVAYLLIDILTRCFYYWLQTLRVCAVPFLMALVTVAVLATCNIPLGFFSVTGLVLVFGLGLDYMFYLTEHGPAAGKALTVTAIGLSFITSALSFGALALSGFVPVHIFGLTVFSGLSTAFIEAMCLKPPE